MIMRRNKKLDLILVLIWPIIASLISFWLKTNFFVSSILYLVIPAFYISLKHPTFIKKALIFSSSALPILLVLDYMAVTTGTWYFPISIVPYRLFGITTLEVLFWYFT